METRSSLPGRAKAAMERWTQRRDHIEMLEPEYVEHAQRLHLRFDQQFYAGSEPETVLSWKLQAAAQADLAQVGERYLAGGYGGDVARYESDLMDAVHVYATAHKVPVTFERERAQLCVVMNVWLTLGVNPLQDVPKDTIMSPVMMVEYTKAVLNSDFEPREHEVEAVAQHYSRFRLAYQASFAHFEELANLDQSHS